MNKVILLGYLSSEPETKVFESKINNDESILVRFSVGVNDIKNRDISYFINCVSWNQTAQYISDKLHKGDFVSIEGRLTNRSYVNNEGKKVYLTEIVVDSIRNYGSKKNTDDVENDANKSEEEYVTIEKKIVDEKKESNDWESDLE